MEATKAGGSRQDLHERLRQHSLAAADQVKQHGRPNDLIDRLRRDAQFSAVRLEEVLEASRFVGRAPEQVEQFVERVAEPIRKRYRQSLGQVAELKV